MLPIRCKGLQNTPVKNFICIAPRQTKQDKLSNFSHDKLSLKSTLTLIVLKAIEKNASHYENRQQTLLPTILLCTKFAWRTVVFTCVLLLRSTKKDFVARKKEALGCIINANIQYQRLHNYESALLVIFSHKAKICP